jgi:hypothetical protein
VAQRFESAVTSGEAVTWTVRYGGSSRVLSGTWRFSNTAGSMLSRFEGSGSSFSNDDGLWGAGTGTVDGDGAGRPADFWGHGNTDSGDYSCATVYLGSSSSTQSALINRMYVMVPEELDLSSDSDSEESDLDLSSDSEESDLDLSSDSESESDWGLGYTPVPEGATLSDPRMCTGYSEAEENYATMAQCRESCDSAAWCAGFSWGLPITQAPSQAPSTASPTTLAPTASPTAFPTTTSYSPSHSPTTGLPSQAPTGLSSQAPTPGTVPLDPLAVTLPSRHGRR